MAGPHVARALERHEGSNAAFKRAAVKNYRVAGFQSQGGDHVLIEDSVLHDNEVGVLITGDNPQST